ncbi:MAG: hypothetical protein IPI78_12290 [Chitinophagaceae bacterium]|nr:hypothetical protein [Chitinophagaceae bacterium]
MEILRRDTLNQLKNSTSDMKSYDVRAVYTEPLWRRSLLNLVPSNSKKHSAKETFDYNKNNGKYDNPNNF